MLPTDPPDLRERMVSLPTGAALHVVERPGAGTPVLFLHGIWSWWRHWLPLLTPPLAALAGRRLIMPDLRGHGWSSRPASDYTIAAGVADIMALIAQERISRLTLAGHSFGTLIGLLLVPQLGDRVESLLLEEPPLPIVGTDLAALSVEGWIEATMTAAWLKHQPREVAVAALIEQQPELPRQEAEETVRCLSLVDDRIFEAALTIVPVDVLQPPAEPCRRPALVIQGGEPDRRMLQNSGVAMLRRMLPAMHLETIPSTGHSVLGEAPAAYRAAVEQFFA